MDKCHVIDQMDNKDLKMVHQFLIDHNFEDTAGVLITEAVIKGFKNVEKVLTDDETNANCYEQLMLSFKTGSWRTFFKLWNFMVPQEVKQTKVYKIMTLNLHVYFAMLPKRILLLHWYKDKDKTHPNAHSSVTSLNQQHLENEENSMTEIEKDMNDSMEQLRKFLNTTGKELENDTQLRPFFALPFIEDPYAEPFLSKVFEKSWVDELSQNLHLFLTKYRQNSGHTTHDAKDRNKGSSDHESILEKLKKSSITDKTNDNNNVPIIANDRHIPMFLEENEIREQQTLNDYTKYNQKSKSIQTTLMDFSEDDIHSRHFVRDNQKLVQCTQELAVTKSHLCSVHSNYEKLKLRFHKLHADYHKLMSIARVLTTALENSVKGQIIDFQMMLETCIKIFPDLFNQNIRDSSHCFSELQLNKSHSEMKIVEHSISYITPVPPKLLDFKKIKLHLINGSVKTKLLLLQALRRKVTCSQPGERDETIHEYISKDLLGLHGQIASYKGKSILPYLLIPENIIIPHPLQQSTTRLLNALASFRCGRDYLSFDSTVVNMVFNCLNSTCDNDVDTFTCNMMIAMLQKLSLRKQQRIYMIENGLVEWLIHHLHNQCSIMDSYRLEYTTALLMNLSLHQIAQRRASAMASLLISTLIALLLIDHTSALPYINGALNNFLTNHMINEEAKKMKFSSILEQYSKHKTGEIRKHLDHVLKIHRGEITIKTENEDMADNDNEEFDVLENELEENDPVKNNCGELSGESLLVACYTTLPKATHENKMISDMPSFKQLQTDRADSIIHDNQQVKHLYHDHESVHYGKNIARLVKRKHLKGTKNNTMTTHDYIKETLLKPTVHVSKLVSSSTKDQLNKQVTNVKGNCPSDRMNTLKSSKTFLGNCEHFEPDTKFNISKNYYKSILPTTHTQLNTITMPKTNSTNKNITGNQLSKMKLQKQFNVNVLSNKRSKNNSTVDTHAKTMKNKMNTVNDVYNESAVYLYENQSSKESSRTTIVSSILPGDENEGESTVMGKLSSIASLSINSNSKSVTDSVLWLQESEFDTEEAFLAKPKLPRTPP